MIGAGVPLEWVKSEIGVTVQRLPIYYGVLSYRLRYEAPGTLRLSLAGDLTLPPGKIVIQPPLPAPLKTVLVNGKPVDGFTADSVTIDAVTADVVMQY